MSQIRLYIDEDAAEHAVVVGLRTRGIDVVTVLDAGMAHASDEEQLAYAIAQDQDGLLAQCWRLLRHFSLNATAFPLVLRSFASVGGRRRFMGR